MCRAPSPSEMARQLLDLEGRTRQIDVHVILAGLPAMLGPPCAKRDLALALVISRVAAPASKLSILTWPGRHHAGGRPGHVCRVHRPGVCGDGLAGRLALDMASSCLADQGSG